MEQLNRIIADNLFVVGAILVIWFIISSKREKRTPQKPIQQPTDANPQSIPISFSLDDEIKSQGQTQQAPQTTLTPAKKAEQFIALWPEVWMIPLMLIIGGGISYGLMLLWPDAIFFGPEHIQKVLYKAIASFLAYFLFFVRDRLDFKEAWQWYKSNTRINEFETLTPWQKRIAYFWRLSVFVLVFALV